MAGVKGRSGGARKGTGPKPFQPTAEHRTIAEMGAALGLKANKIALRIINPATKLPITDDMVRKHFALEMERGLSTAIYQVGAALINAAKKGSVEAQKFFLKTRGKWSENVNVTVRRPEDLSDEELDAAIAALIGNEPPGEGTTTSGSAMPRATTGESSTRH